ncbi:hypothetical protein OG21DRAFT_1103719 [Imleria badia]|nr:hypothetical protein OG21DRAFT_1103719 [Imleria badia]
MSNFPQDVYARNLLSHRGYPLWTPEPNIELPEGYQREGLRIGDIGVVVPEDGSFDVFFNITLPREHPLHAPDGVPLNFTQVKLRREDYRIVPDAEYPGRVISSSSVECTVSCVDPFDLNGKSHSLTDHQFSLCQNEGAMLILPEGAQRHRLAKELLLLDVIIENAIDWYRFAREQLYRNIRNDDLYLVTGFHKACSWSLASFKNTGASSARCKLVQLTNGGRILTPHSIWETARPLEWRIGPRHSDGIPNQSVFITGFKIAVNEELLHLKRVTVKVAHSKRTLASRLVGFGASLANVLVGVTSWEIHTPQTATRDESSDQLTIEHDEHAGEDECAGITVERVPHVPQPFHPSDIINRYLLTKEPSAMFAVTHDSQWISLLEKGLLRPEELKQVGRLEAILSCEYHIVTKDGVVYLQNIE